MMGDETTDDERGDYEISIAELVAALSTAEDTPSEFRPTAREISVSAVDFASPTWMTCLAEVEGWLRFPGPLPLDSPEEFLGALTSALYGESAAITLEPSPGGQPRLTVELLARLNARLQQAAQLQELFLRELEADGATKATATARWLEAWEETDAEPVGTADASTGPVAAKASTLPISTLTYRARRGWLNLSPSYQRGDVWPTADAQLLIESIVRGIPLPSIILLKQDDGQTWEVVDGKQRLTSILRFTGKHPRALEHVREAERRHKGSKFEDLFSSDYPAFKRAWKTIVGEPLTATQEREYYFPFKLRPDSDSLTGQLQNLRGKYYTQILSAKVSIADNEYEIRDVFEEAGTEYAIPVIEYQRASRRQIHEVFNLYNRQGKHLNAEEIRNAVYHEVDLARALLVLAGDNNDVEAVAPFLNPKWDQFGQISTLLTDYNFGSARYRRTKVLSWLASVLFMDAMEGDKPRTLTTARHIDTLFDRIGNNKTDPLLEPVTLLDATTVLHTAIEAHSSVDEAWSPQFKDTDQGKKWQELQLIASLVGVSLAAVVLGDATEQRLIDRSGELRDRSESKLWRRPEKTQTITQWQYIAGVALDVLSTLGIAKIDAKNELKRRFGFECVTWLAAVAATDRTGKWNAVADAA